MASTKDRQRKLERARAERRLAALAHRARRKRQMQASIGASVALIVIVAGVTWLLGGFDSKPANPTTVAAGSCSWTLKDPATDPNVVDVGHPPTDGAPTTGTQTMTLKTNLGDIEATLDLTKVPCTAASFTYLASKNYFDNTICPRVSSSLKVLRCGDPKNNGSGGPAYVFADENKPDTTPLPDASGNIDPSATARPGPYYAKGDIIMVNTGPNTNGSQFYIITDNGSDLSAAYSIVGTVTKGMDIVDAVYQAGAVDDKGAAVAEGKPKKAITIQQLVMSDAATAPAGSTEPTPSTSAS